jgi:alkylhydroperoxidase/carboxymuconolactone decarboxylase family protein YurZ
MEEHGQPRRRWFEVLQEYQPETLELYYSYSTEMQGKRIDIDDKIAEFILIAVDAVVDWKNIDSHVNKAFDAGATIQELLDVCAITAMQMGPHAFNSGITAVDRVIQKRKAAGLRVPRDRRQLESSRSVKTQADG